jgi:2'-5' RNA ligase superfamily protein
VGRFGRAGALWLGPAACAELAALHRDAYRSLEQAGWAPAFGEHSAPALWVAHCTLATRVPKPQLRRVQDVVRAAYQPISGRVDAVATIRVGGSGDVAHAPLAEGPGTSPTG